MLQRWLGRRRHWLTVCEPLCLRQLVSPQRMLRGTVAAVLLGVHRPGLPAWLSMLAVSWSTTRRTRPDEPTEDDRAAILRGAIFRLRRSSATRADWEAELKLGDHELLALANQATNTAGYWRYRRLADFGRTLSVFWLESDAVSSEERERFRAFCHDLRPEDSAGQVFERQLGFSYATLLDRWQSWLADQLEPPASPPTALQLAALRKHALPVLRDPDALVTDRTEVIRAIAADRVTAAAGPLIEELERPVSPLREEIVAALPLLTGQSFGDRVADWRTWWQQLPADLRADFPLAPSPFDPAAATVPRAVRVATGILSVGALWAIVTGVLLLFLSPMSWVLADLRLGMGLLAWVDVARRSFRNAAVSLMVLSISCDPLALALGTIALILLRRASK